MNTIGVTGSSGFLGQHLLSFFAKSTKVVRMFPFTGDVRNKKQVERFVKKCDLVIHLAAKNRLQPEREIIDTNVIGALNVVDACFSLKKGFLTCVERTLTTDAFSASKNVCRSFISEFNKLGLQGFVMKLDPVIGPSRPVILDKDPGKLLELLDVEDVCKWIFSFSDAFLTNGSFYVKEFEFWDPIRISVKDFAALLSGRVVENVSLEHAQKILKYFE